MKIPSANVFLLQMLVMVTGFIVFSSCSTKKESEAKTIKPNIVWIMLEDWGYQLSCYGEPGVETPYIDAVAAEGIRYTNSFCTAPVCSPSRSAMMTGFHQNFIGANQHRTAEKFGFPKKTLSNQIKPITQLLQEQGYYTCLMESNKTDLNFTFEGELFNGKDWKDRSENQPFFAQITFQGTHRRWKRDVLDSIDIAEIRLPPYYPQTDLAKRDWANGLEAMQIVDREVGEILDRLEKEGLKENTVVFIIGDNGRCMPRGKQFLYDGGIQVPMIVRWPEKIKKAKVSENLVTTLDISKTIIDVAGAKSAVPLHGKNLLKDDLTTRKYIFAARDKMDSTYDAMRAIRSKEYKLIHNLMPERPYCQFNSYKERFYPVLAQLNVMNLEGTLDEDQAQFMAASKPEFELYDLKNDPWELQNLADNIDYQEVKAELLSELNQWRKMVNDQGVTESFRKGGWSAEYPTRTLEQWETHLSGFEPWVFRETTSKMTHPYLNKK
ncbi:MAG: sulfatase [Bacteroidota bacterium]